MDTVLTFAFSCFAVALAAGLIAAILESRQLALAVAVVTTISAATIIIVFAVKTWEDR
jgi:hypothetical protein